MSKHLERNETGKPGSSPVATAIVSGLIGGLVGGVLATWLLRKSGWAEPAATGSVLEGALVRKNSHASPEVRLRREQTTFLTALRSDEALGGRDPRMLEDAFARVADAPSMRAFGWLIEAGDAWITARQSTAALRTFTRAREVAERRAAADSSSGEWEHALSVSHQRIGDTLTAQGRLNEALESYQAGLQIARKLALAVPSNTEWQIGLAILYVKLGMLEAPASSKALRREHLLCAEQLVEQLQGAHRLREAHQQSWPAVIRQALEELDRSPDP